MPTTISVQKLQALLGVTYVLVASVALLRSRSLELTLVAVGLMVGGYLTSRTVPASFVSRDAALKLCAVAAIVIIIGIVADVMADRHALVWAAAVMGYCAGNRFRAAGVGPAR